MCPQCLENKEVNFQPPYLVMMTEAYTRYTGQHLPCNISLKKAVHKRHFEQRILDLHHVPCSHLAPTTESQVQPRRTQDCRKCRMKNNGAPHTKTSSRFPLSHNSPDGTDISKAKPTMKHASSWYSTRPQTLVTSRTSTSLPPWHIQGSKNLNRMSPNPAA